MDLNLAGKVAVVTGAGKGIGMATTRALASEGAQVVAGSLSTDTLDALKGVTPVAVDLTAPGGPAQLIRHATEEHGRIDVLVNNAGRTQVGAVEETTDEELRSLFELHFFAPVALTRLVLPHMRREGGGAIVQMSSVGGQTTAPGFGAYCATKFALEGLTRRLDIIGVPLSSL